MKSVLNNPTDLHALKKKETNERTNQPTSQETKQCSSHLFTILHVKEFLKNLIRFESNIHAVNKHKYSLVSCTVVAGE